MITIFIIFILCVVWNAYIVGVMMDKLSIQDRMRNFIGWFTSFIILILVFLCSLLLNYTNQKLVKQNYKCPELERVDNVYRIK